MLALLVRAVRMLLESIGLLRPALGSRVVLLGAAGLAPAALTLDLDEGAVVCHVFQRVALMPNDAMLCPEMSGLPLIVSGDLPRRVDE